LLHQQPAHCDQDNDYPDDGPKKVAVNDANQAEGQQQRGKEYQAHPKLPTTHRFV
jgi:hypothetical protein